MRFPLPARYLLALGLLVLISSFWLRRQYVLPDGASGFVVGVGLGLELLALRQAKRPTC
jgi:hypothetical protein